jgi:hypothetical protein
MNEPLAPTDDGIRRTISIRGRNVHEGMELSFTGYRGRYRFRFARLDRQTREITELAVFGGPEAHQGFRSFSPDRLKTVHRTEKMRG